MALKPRLTGGIALLAIASIALAACGDDDDDQASEDAQEFTLTIAANAIIGGKNSDGAQWIQDWVIPNFIRAQAEKGVTASVEFIPSGVDDEDYKTRIALDMSTGGGADIIALDGIWVGEFAQAGYIKPLSEVAGADVDQWEGWSQIPDAVQGLGEFDGQRYGVPLGTDGRVLYYNKTLFQQAGLPTDWQPTSWQEIIDAGEALAQLDGVTPIQINAGTAMGEATTMQGMLPLLVGAGQEIYTDGKWTGGSPAMKDVLGFYQQIYSSGLGDPLLQQEAQGRDKSFQLFADGKIGILAEGDYFWRSVVEPTAGIAPMADRNEVVGFALIPAKTPGTGIRGQDFVSMSGGGVRVINPNTDFPKQAWELLSFMHSAAATEAELGGAARITARADVNVEVLSGDPMLSFVAEQVLPITAYRPPLAVYPEVSVALQEATADIVSGASLDEAAANYQSTLEDLVGGAANVAS